MRLSLGSADTGIDVRFIRHSSPGEADWSVFGPEHEVRVWRRGTANSKEVVFDRGPNGRINPRVSDVWVIPAGLDPLRWPGMLPVSSLS